MVLNPEEARRLAGELLVGEELEGEARLSPGSFGRYRITRLVGVGGMGEVYEAEQEHPARRVAIKVIRPELVTGPMRRRFEHEARILGRLEHPGIARIYEAGQAETPGGTTPYFAMEFVEGRPLTEYAAEGKLGVRERLGLFLRACDAVEHAHRKGIIHRDLKPGNILVAAGEDGAGPKVLDFGVARATDADVRSTTLHTDVGKLVGTLPYMSPEQAGAEDGDGLDTRSDVYSLGVILYELLSGRLPYEVKRGMIPEAVRVIRETEAPPLSSVDRALRGDLETIAAKALEKEKERRYQSVGELAADLRRYLSDEPIVARRASSWYQFRKFARRNRPAVVAGATVSIAIAALAAGSLWVAVSQSRAAADLAVAAKTERELRAVAEERLRSLQRQTGTTMGVVEFLERVLEKADPRRGTLNITVLEALDGAAERLARGDPSDPYVAAAIHLSLGRTFETLGEVNKSIRHLRAALDLWRSLPQSAPDEVAESMRVLCQALGNAGKFDECLSLSREFLEYANDHFGPDDRVAVYARQMIAFGLWRKGDLDGALKTSEEAYAIAAPLLLADRSPFSTLTAQLGLLYFEKGRLREAKTKLVEALEVQRRFDAGELPDDTYATEGNLISVLSELGEHDEAARRQRDLLERARRTLGDDHPHTLTALGNLGSTLLRAGRFVEAEPFLRDAFEQHLRRWGKDDVDTLLVMCQLADSISRQGRHAEALEMYDRGLTAIAGAVGPDHHLVITTLEKIAKAHGRAGDHVQEEERFREAASLAELRYGLESSQCTRPLQNLCDAFLEQGRFDEALGILEDVSQRVSAWPPGHQMRSRTSTALGRCYVGLEQYAKARKSYQDSLKELEVAASVRPQSAEEEAAAVRTALEAIAGR